MKKTVDAVIAIPFCEKEYDILLDTIRSVEYYVKEKHHIIAIDDFSPSRLDERLRKEMPRITVLRNPRRQGGRSGLYITQASACKHALDNFNFGIYIKMDTDALMCGSGLVTEALARLKAAPRVGMLGSYTARADNKPRNWYRWKAVLLYESSPIRRLLKKPVLWGDTIKAARKQGYDLGENVLGGCYIISSRCLEAMRTRGYLDYEYDNVLTHSTMGEDVIYSLYCKASGFDIADFGRPGDPMVIALDVVPMTKEEVMAEGKSIIHSVKKGLKGETQEELREYFRSFRK